MTIVTMEFPDERVRTSHIHRGFSYHDEAVGWVRDILDRFGSRIVVDYAQTAGGWKCSRCEWRMTAGRLPKTAVTVSTYFE